MAYTIGRSALDNTPTPTRLGVPSIQDYLGNFQSQNDIWRQSWSPQFNTPYQTAVTVDPMADVQDSILNPNPTGNNQFGGWDSPTDGVNESPANAAQNTGMANARGFGIAGTLTGVPGLGPLGAAIGSAVDVNNANAHGMKSMGVNPDISYFDTLKSALSFGLFGNSASNQLSDELGVMATTPDGNMFSDEDDMSTMTMDDLSAMQAAAAASASAAATSSGGSSPSGPDSGPGSPGSADPGGDGEGWAKGGWVNKSALFGRNPKGPDDGAGYLDDGEYVIRAKAAKKLNKMQPGLLDMLNQI